MTPSDQVPNRFPRSVFGHGSEPDPRFTLANERTFLAWIRTGLALMAAGVALEALSVDIDPWLRAAAALLLVIAGLAAVGQSWLGWAGTERAIRMGLPLPSSPLKAVMALGIAAAGLALLVGAIL